MNVFLCLKVLGNYSSQSLYGASLAIGKCLLRPLCMWAEQLLHFMHSTIRCSRSFYDMLFGCIVNHARVKPKAAIMLIYRTVGLKMSVRLFYIVSLFPIDKISIKITLIVTKTVFVMWFNSDLWKIRYFIK